DDGPNGNTSAPKDRSSTMRAAWEVTAGVNEAIPSPNNAGRTATSASIRSTTVCGSVIFQATVSTRSGRIVGPTMWLNTQPGTVTGTRLRRLRIRMSDDAGSGRAVCDGPRVKVNPPKTPANEVGSSVP